MHKQDAIVLDLLYPERNYWRPETRDQCAQGMRPCPYVSCKHHLYLDVTEIGSIQFNFPDLEVWDMDESCALDVADKGGAVLEQVGEALNITRERARQIEDIAVPKLRSGLRQYR